MWTVHSAIARQRSACASSFGRPPAMTRLIVSGSRSHTETYDAKETPPPPFECGDSFGSCGLGFVGSVGICSPINFPPLQAVAASGLKTLAFGQLSAVVLGAATDTLPHAGSTMVSGDQRFRSGNWAVLASNNTSQSSDQCRDTPRILVALTSDPVAIACAWRSASQPCRPQSRF